VKWTAAVSEKDRRPLDFHYLTSTSTSTSSGCEHKDLNASHSRITSAEELEEWCGVL